MNFFRTTDTTDTTIWKPGLTPPSLLKRMFNFSQSRPSVGFLLIASRMCLELKTFLGNSHELFCKMMVICGAQIFPSHFLYSSSSDLS